MDYHQIVCLLLNGKSFYCIWSSTENDVGFFTENDKLLFFDSAVQAKAYAVSFDLELDDDMYICSADSIEQWAKSSDNGVDCKNILDFWNIIIDISTSAKIGFLGNHKTKRIDGVYDKLFYGNNLFVEKEEEKYIPDWSDKEVLTIKNMMLHGLSTLKKAIEGSQVSL